MQNDSDPRFRESEFLKLMQQIKSGELALDESQNDLIKNPNYIKNAPIPEEKKINENEEDPMKLLDKYWESLQPDLDFEYFLIWII